MLKKLEQYLASHYLRFDNEQILFGKERIVLYFVPQLAKEFITNRKEFGLRYCTNMFFSGRDMGFQFVQKHGVPLKKILTPVIQISCDLLNTFGFGVFRTIKVDSKEGFMVVVGKSALAHEIKRNFNGSNEPVDFMLAGLFAGAAEYFMKEHRYAVETLCVAQREVQECVWVIGKQENIIEFVKNVSPERIDWTVKILEEIKSAEIEKERTKENKDI